MPIRRHARAAALVVVFAGAAHAAPLSPERVQQLCANVEGPTHCGRLIEAEQFKALPNLATRDGDTLRVTLYPTGTRDFVDVATASNDRSYTLWDYWSPINAVVLLVTSGDTITYALFQRATGQYTVVPAEPVLSPDRQHVAVADFCAQQCANEVSLWRVTRDGLRKDATFAPAVPWADVTVSWKSPEVLTIQYKSSANEPPKTVERALTASDWRRI